MPANISGAVAADGNVLVLAAPAASITSYTAPTVAALTANTAKDITYDLTAAGLTWTTAEDSVPNERFTLKQVLSLPGRRTLTVSLQYVINSPADTLFVEGADFVIAVRWGVDHDTAVTVGDKFDLIKVRAGHASHDAPAANTNLTITQGFYALDVAVEDVALV